MMSMGDEVDANPVGPTDDSDKTVEAGIAGLSLGASVPVAVTDDDSDTEYRYCMNHGERGKFIIINNENFLKQTKQGKRSGTDKDAQNLYVDFKKLGFEVVLAKDRTADEMEELMKTAAAEDHSDRDCFAVAILSHGEMDYLYGTDRIIDMKKLIDPIKQCSSLAGKPKIFIIQACRGTEFDGGQNAPEAGQNVADAVGERPRPPQRIPIEADFLYVYSTTPGYFSFRHPEKGSWFIQALHGMIERHADKLDFVSLLTFVNHEVAYKFESRTKDPEKAYMNRKKQASSFVCMLTKQLYFTKK